MKVALVTLISVGVGGFALFVLVAYPRLRKHKSAQLRSDGGQGERERSDAGIAVSDDTKRAFESVIDAFKRDCLAYYIRVFAYDTLDYTTRERLLAEYPVVRGGAVLNPDSCPALAQAGFSVQNALLAEYLESVGRIDVDRNYRLNVESYIHEQAERDAEIVVKKWVQQQ